MASLLALAVALSPVLVLGLAAFSGITGSASQVYAQDPPAEPPKTTKDCNGNDVTEAQAAEDKPVLCEADIVKEIEKGKGAANCAKGVCVIERYLNPFINTLAAMVGIAVTISIIVAGIRYSTSADNPQKVSEAKQRIVTSIMVLIGFFLFYFLLDYIIPGGVSGGGQ